MANALGVCLIAITIFGCTELSFARQVPKECAKGPSYWCRSLRNAAECGSVGHCTGTVWETQNVEISKNDISDKFIKLFKEMKDINDLINEEYLAQRVRSACNDLPYPAATKICRENTAYQEKYINHVLAASVTPETLCQIVGMCNNMKLDNIITLNKKKASETGKHKEHLLGASRCTWGPSYWCSNFSTGRECKATHHCVERVWSSMEVEQDTDSICQICTDMVKQARDQLQSNETQEDLKQVFEGSCRLMPIKAIRDECTKLADDFVPELVETLASEMNPQVVCSVAGLCNSARIDLLLDRYNEQLKMREECNSCRKTVTVARKKFDATSYEDFLVGLLQLCRKTGSLSDSCSMLIFQYYENIVAAVKKDLEPRSVCHLSGQCTQLYHNHDEFVFHDEDLTKLTAKDDVPCEFCEQLVNHLRDILVANTTEIEFMKVLKGICKQTGNFKDECLSLAEQYYPVFYSYLISELNAKELCSFGGMCPSYATSALPIAPMLAEELLIKSSSLPSKLIGTDEANAAKFNTPIANKHANVKVMGTEGPPPPLPIERMFVSMPEGKSGCAFCEYFLHYIQVELSDTKTEEKIKDVVDKACDRLPESVSGECKEFVSGYGPAVIALLVQEIDPASVCPALGVCPKVHEVRRVDINSEKSNCPLCLFAVMQLETVLHSNRTEASIRAALNSLCNHLSAKLRTECVDFVETYSEQLIEMLITHMNAQEICVYLKLCKDETTTSPVPTHPSIDKFHEKPRRMSDRNNHKRPMLPKHMLEGPDGDIETNEIPDHTVNGRPVKQKSFCVICEFVMKEIDDEIKDKNNDDEIKKAVHSICKRMPKSVQPECDKFVEQYADLVISLLAQELEPAEVCQALKLCDPASEFNQGLDRKAKKVQEEILDCAVCEVVVMAVKKVMSNDKVDHDIVHVVEKACSLLPAKYYDRCHTLMEIYGDSVIHLIEDYGTKGVCQKIGLCGEAAGAYVHMHKKHHCETQYDHMLSSTIEYGNH